jgi:hypothetical protein
MANGIDLATLTWFKSSRSSGTGQCALCARLPGGGMAVRDSKHPDGPVLLFGAAEWQAFIQHIKRNEHAPTPDLD